jgi:hypothetical protein
MGDRRCSLSLNAFGDTYNRKTFFTLVIEKEG